MASLPRAAPIDGPPLSMARAMPSKACSASQISLTAFVQLTRSNADIRSARGWRRRRASANAASRIPMITDENW